MAWYAWRCMNDSLLELHARLACLGPISRFRLALELLARERCVSELAIAVGLSQSCTTRHLQSMQRAGLLERQRAGKRVLFRLAPEATGLLALLGSTRDAAPAPIVGGTRPAPPPRATAPRSAKAPTRKPRARVRETVRRVTAESVTPPAAEVSAPRPRHRELEDFLL